MPYCSTCGTEVAGTDAYCARCGTRQPVSAPPADPLGNVTPRNASLLCYIPLAGWIAAIVVLASSRFKTDRTVRFHAFQGIYLFVAWLLIDWAVGPFFPEHIVHFSIAGVLKGAIFVVWIIMIIKTSQNEMVRLPLLGELAERSIAEQR